MSRGERIARAILLGVVGLFLGLHLVVPHLRTRRWWAFDQLGAWGPAAEIVFALAAALALAAPFAVAVVRRRVRRGRRPVAGRTLIPAAALGALALFWLFRSGSDVWGDGVMRVDELGHVRYDWRFRGAEPLDGLLHEALYRATRLAPAKAWALVSVLAGGILVALSLSLESRARPRWIIPGFLLTTGAMALFCGHLESYSLAPVAVLGFLLVGLRTLDGGLRPALGLPLAAGVLAVAALLHVSSLYLLPSLLVVAGETFVARPGARAPALISVLATIAFTAWKLGDLRSLGGSSTLGLAGDEPAVHAYGLASGAHLIDLADFLLLLAPVPAAAFLAGIPAFVRRARRREVDRAELFLVTAAAGALALFVGLDPRLGSRDWDLMAFPAFPVALAAGTWAARWAAGASWRPGVIGIALLAAALHAAVWVVALASPARSLTLAERMVAEDPHHAGGGRLWFAAYLDRAGLIDRAIAQYRIAARDPSARARALFGEGQALRHAGREEEGAAKLAEACAADPLYIPARVVLGDAELARGRWSAARDEFEAALRVNRENLDWWMSAAAAGTQRDELGAALDLERRAAARVLPDHEVRALIGLGIALIQLGRDDEAARALHQATRLDPGNAAAHLQYARALVAAHPAEAAEELRTALRIEPASAEIHFRLATVLETLGRTAEAAAEYRETSRLQPSKSAEFCAMGARAMAAGRRDEARRAYSIALQLDPGNAEALAALRGMEE